MRVRAFFAVLPLTIPLVLSTSEILPPAGKAIAARPPRVSPEIRYSLLQAPPKPLPGHSMYVPIRPGDTLDNLIVSAGISTRQAFELSKSFADHVDLRRLRNGDFLRLNYDASNNLDAIELKVRGWGRVTAAKQNDSFAVTANPGVQTSTERIVSAQIDSSLYEAVRAAGEGPQIVSDLVDIFQWDVDFFALQKDDWFSVVVDKKFCGEDHTGYGPILAARFHHEGQTFEAIRFVAPDGTAGYYTANGVPVRKQFLKAPLKYTRVTSGFTMRRFHPILHTFRAHPGVDYGAPVGTPVMSTADGVVIFAGYKGGEGNFVRIKHNSRIQTNYLHLSRFAKGIRVGSKITQGDVIGYVGMTGLATGPHLDYRVSDGGKWLNPAQLKSITPDPLGGKSLRAFKAAASNYGAKLASSPEELAAAATPRHSFGKS